MSLNDKKRRILELIERKKISAEEGMDLLRILEKKEKRQEQKIEEQKRQEQKKQGQKAGKAASLPPVRSGKREEPQRAEIVKLSEKEYEVLPIERSGTDGKKKSERRGASLFSNRKLVIRVEEQGKPMVNLRLPLGIAAPFFKGALKFGQAGSPEFAEYMKYVDPKELEQSINTGEQTVLVDLYDEEDDERVFIGIE